MKIGDRIFVRGYIDEIRKDTVIVRNNGGYFGTVLSEVTGELPSAQPERKTGKWITCTKGSVVTAYKCSECGRTVRDDTGYDVAKDYPFCHCGADMRGEQDVDANA